MHLKYEDCTRYQYNRRCIGNHIFAGYSDMRLFLIVVQSHPPATKPRSCHLGNHSQRAVEGDMEKMVFGEQLNVTLSPTRALIDVARCAAEFRYN